GDVHGAHALVQLVLPVAQSRGVRVTAEQVAVHAHDPGVAGAAVVGDVLGRADEAGLQVLVGQAVVVAVDPVGQAGRFRVAPQVTLVGGRDQVPIELVA